MDVFISYKREDQADVKALADSLVRAGLTVWWDRELLAGAYFDQTIERELSAASCVVVVWSSRSVESQYVRDEATYALNRNKLIPISFDGIEPPFRFQGLHTLHVTRPVDAEINKPVKGVLVAAIRARLDRVEVSAPPNASESGAVCIEGETAHLADEICKAVRDSGIQAPPNSPMSALNSLLPAKVTERLQSVGTAALDLIRKSPYGRIRMDGVYCTITNGFKQTTVPDRFSLTVVAYHLLALYFIPYKNSKEMADKRCEEEAASFARDGGYSGFTVLSFRITMSSKIAKALTRYAAGVAYEVHFHRSRS